MVKRLESDELQIVVELASSVWHGSHDELLHEFSTTLNNNDEITFLKYLGNTPVGFAQCKLRRDYVEGTHSSPVGYLEGIFIKEQYRKKGYATELLSACEQWAKEHGCSEFASDCELDNNESLSFHLKAGFNEVNRIICFTKLI